MKRVTWCAPRSRQAHWTASTRCARRLDLPRSRRILLLEPFAPWRRERLFRRDRLRGLECFALHLPAHAHGVLIAVERDIGVSQNLAGGDIAGQFHMMRKPDRQRAEREALRRWNELGIDRVAAFAVEHFAGF